MYIFLISRCSSAVYCSRLLFIFDMDLQCIWLVAMRSILSRAWVCPPRWDIWYFCRWHVPIPDFWAHLFSTSVHIGKELVMYFGHRMLFWPHTLGGICYNPNFHQTCLSGIRPSQIPSLPKHFWTNLLKNLIYKGPCALLHYCTRVHTSWPKTARVPTKAWKKESCQWNTQLWVS
jgi:hypothetical protein